MAIVGWLPGADLTVNQVFKDEVGADLKWTRTGVR